LAAAAAPEVALTHRSPLSIGALAGHWCAYGFAPDMPADQRAEDGKSLLFDSAPLAANLEILGAPVVTLELAADQPQAQVCVRLNDVAPDGASLRISYGLLNLSHRDSHEAPTPLEPGESYRVRVQLNDIAHVFPAGHRIRAAVSTSYWPIAWPSPAPVTLTVFAGASVLELPVRPPRAEDAALTPFLPAEATPALQMTEHRPDTTSERVTYDLTNGTMVFTTDEDHGRYTIDAIDFTSDHTKKELFRIAEDDPTSATIDIANSRNMSRGDWNVRTETRTVMRATATEFIVEATLDAYEGDIRVVSRNSQVRHRRDFV
jgi:hypothetical protein